MRVYHWENAPREKPANVQVCDIEGHRMIAKRVRKGAREFTVLLDGKDLKWQSESLEAAKEAAEAHFDQHFPDYDKLD